ncbi:SMI1/KNR4 family protein [Tabrizicola sp.]|uniref:SMI1/KNR4 family protein n=1 Tax=Tabrizicola sp. TaxID=2005166 RepID=UPI003F2C96BF
MLLRTFFPDGRFSRPATAQEIDGAERTIGAKLPEQLRRLYLECDGFREPRGNAEYLLSLSEVDTTGSLTRTNAFWHHEFPRITTYCPDFRGFIFFGMSSGDESWAIDQDGLNVIAYHHSMGDEYEVVGHDITQVYLHDFELYDAV